MNYTYQQKSTINYNFLEKSDVTIYLTSENGDYYLVGQDQNEFLVLKEVGSYNYLEKN